MQTARLKSVSVAGLLAAGMFALTFCAITVAPVSGAQAMKKTIFAQKLVDAAHAKHPEAGEIGISAVSSGACKGIASTDRSDVGEKCEKDDSEPMRTGKPFVEKEKTSFDVALPLHDSSGKLVGSVGIELKPQAGETQEDVVRRAQAIAQDMESQIASKAKLFEVAD